MIARSGNMQMAPMAPVNVRRWGPAAETLPCEAEARSRFDLAEGRRIIEGLGTGRNRDIVTYGHRGTQGADRSVARATRCVSLLQRRRRHHLRGQGACFTRPR